MAEFHAAIRAYGPGEHGDAREDAKRRQTEMKGRLPLVVESAARTFSGAA